MRGDTDEEVNISFFLAEKELNNIVFDTTKVTVQEDLYSTLYANFRSHPYASFDNSMQVSVNRDIGQSERLPIAQYCTEIMIIVDPVGTDNDYILNIADHFFTNLDSDLNMKIKEYGYSGDITINNRDPFMQSDLNKGILNSADDVEKKIT